jgi:hypothetical protein
MAKARIGPGVELKVSVVGITPTIWRTVQLPLSLTLAKTHQVLQRLLGWTDSHLYMFVVGQLRFGPRLGHDFDAPATIDDKKVRLAELDLRKGAKLKYKYDFGDSWEVSLTVAKLLDETPTAPTCLAGERAGPPDDCGGIWGYDELIAAIADPNHPDHADRKEWVGYDFVVRKVQTKPFRHAPSAMTFIDVSSAWTTSLWRTSSSRRCDRGDSTSAAT